MWVPTPVWYEMAAATEPENNGVRNQDGTAGHSWGPARPGLQSHICEGTGVREAAWLWREPNHLKLKSSASLDGTIFVKCIDLGSCSVTYPHRQNLTLGRDSRG